jgi:hypothetical protein
MKSDEWYCMDFKMALSCRMYGRFNIVFWLGSNRVCGIQHSYRSVCGKHWRWEYWCWLTVPLEGSLSLVIIIVHLPRVVSVVCCSDAQLLVSSLLVRWSVSGQVKLCYLTFTVSICGEVKREVCLISFLSLALACSAPKYRANCGRMTATAKSPTRKSIDPARNEGTQGALSHAFRFISASDNFVPLFVKSCFVNLLFGVGSFLCHFITIFIR